MTEATSKPATTNSVSQTHLDAGPAARSKGNQAELPWFLRRQLGLRAKRRFPYDSVVRIRFGERAFMLTAPIDIKHVLVSNASHYVKSPHLSSARGKQRQGDGLLTSSGAQHTRQRQMLQPLFNREHVKDFADVIVERTRNMLQSWQGRDEVDISHEMSRLSLSVILGVLFGRAYRDEDAELVRAIHARRRYAESVYHSKLPFRERLPTRTVRENRQAIETIDRVTFREIQRRRKDSSTACDMVSRLIDAEYRDGTKMTDQQVRDEVLSMTSAGHETVGEALCWTCYLISQHPEVEERLLEEYRHVLGGRPPDSADANKLTYTDMVLSESMRLYPPTWIYTRVAVQSDTLPGGARLLGGDTLYLCPYVMHRHPQYFPDVERFDPERFTTAATKSRPRCVYFPFGDGPHTCIGEQLARLEATLVMAQVLQAFRFDVVPGQRIVPSPTITLRPRNGIRMRAIPR